jgi:protocatechuate 3,4-dioxygenase beta subunit
MHQDRSPSAPAYEGRPLPRPGADLEDQGLGFDLGTLVGRRQIFRMIGAGAAGLGLAACTGTGAVPSANPAGAASGEIPEETGGPYPANGSNGPDVLEQSGVVRSDIRSSFGSAGGTAQGVPMTLELTVQNLADGGAPFAGTAVYVWHCDREARYSLYSDGATQENYLRGVQIADAAGKVRFTSIFPACYPGRWPHVHFEVYPDRASIADAGKVIATSQVALPENACEAVYARPGYEQSVENLADVTVAGDNVFRDDGGAAQLGTATGDVTTGYAISLVVRVDTRTPV